MSFAELLARAQVLVEREGRALLGICGPPAAGKSALADALGVALDERAVVVGMDGFHLAQRELERLGRMERKGAPDTFDAAGYLALLARLRGHDDVTGVAAAEPRQAHTVYAPEFRRDIEEPIANAIAVPPECPLVITEGNYLLLDDPPWDGVRALLDEVWFIELPESERLARLVRRHRSFGRTNAQAQARAHCSDQANADRITATAARADLVITGTIILAPE
ncbi:MAG: nucleoside/nucleotide kinase family protein [Sciscionella sp.]